MLPVKIKYSLFVMSLLWSTSLAAQNSGRITGFVRDKTTGEVLIGTTITDTVSLRGTVSDNNGYFTMQIAANSVLKVSYIGYGVEYVTAADTVITLYLEPQSMIETVVVTGTREITANVSSLSVSQMSQIPSLGGKPDIGKALQLLPGIGTQNEGSSRLLVRGGDPGQNMYLFDNVPVIYVNHLGGFMSVFNPDIINHIDVYKGGFPARSGGRLSSIIDIIQKEGNSQNIRGSLSIGLTDLSFSADGPLAKNATFIVTGRKTVSDPLMALATSFMDNGYITYYGFHDLNGKITWKSNARNTFSLNVYYGDDYLGFSSTKRYDTHSKFRDLNMWGNWLVSGHWKSVLSHNLYANTSLSYTRYRLKDKQKQRLVTDAAGTGTTNFVEKTVSSVENYTLKTEFKYTPFDPWTINFGGEVLLSRFLPFYTTGSNIAKQQKRPVFTWENSLFVENTVRFLRHSRIHAGARLVAYSTHGYNNFAIEPRMSASFGITREHHIELSYMKTSQHSHLLFSSGDIMNNEVWIPSDSRIPSSRSHHYTAGYTGHFSRGQFSAGVQVFYKTMNDLAIYKEGYAGLTGDVRWHNKIETGGSGTSKGVEVSLRKNTGKLTGFVSYTLSKTTRRYPAIADGQVFVFDYDRPHQLAVTGNYQINNRLSVSATWTYMTGLPYTPAIGRIQIPSLTGDEPGEELLYGPRNSARMRDYHRLDLGLNWEITTKRNRRAVWTFSVYNAYSRRNPYYYYYNTNDGPDFHTNDPNAKLALYQMSFFPIIPSVSYKIYFNAKSKVDRPRGSANRSHGNLLYREELSLKNRWGMTIGYTWHNPDGVKNHNLRIEGTYGVTRWLEAGIYVGVTAIRFSDDWLPSPQYGVSANIHLLPLFLKNDNIRFDPYITAKFGGLYALMRYYKGNTFEYGAGVGMAYYVGRKLGLYAEYTLGKHFGQLMNLRGGLVIKFGNK